MILAAALLASGLLFIGAILGMRQLDAHHWARTLVAFRVRLPGGLTADDVSRWLEVVAAITSAPKWSLLPYPPVGWEVVATQAGIAHYVVVPKSLQPKLLGLMRSSLPGARIEEAPDYLKNRQRPTVAAELKATNTSRSLRDDRAETATSAFLASVQPLAPGEVMTYQVVLSGAGTPAPIHHASPRPADASWAAYLVAGEVPSSVEAERAARRKQEAGALLNASVRLGVHAADSKRARLLLGRSWGNLHVLSAPGVRLVRRFLPSDMVADRLHAWALPVTRFPMLLNSQELAGLMAMPLGDVSLPGLSAGSSRQIAPAPQIPSRGSVIGVSNYIGTQRPLAIPVQDRLRHLWLIGPTGVGKSTLIANLALQDIAAGSGLALIDPKSDLVETILARIPAERSGDVILLDPSRTENPVGFNLLGGLRNEHERELVVDHVTHVMASIWKDSWGPRSHDLLRNSLLTLVHTRAADGSAFTLAEIPELLVNPTFRRFVTSQRTVPDVVRPFWYAYEQKGEAAIADMTAPLLNKLRQFLTRTSIRLMLGQSSGVDVAEVFTKRKILLAPLSKGTLGTGTAELVGALLTASLWHATLKRAAIPQEQRRPAWMYLDEFQDVLRLPLDVADMLAQARGLGVGVVLAHQHMGQLPESVKTAVLGTARSQVAFQLDYDDARTLANRFTPLTADDLMGQEVYEIAARLSIGGQTLRPVTARTLPLPPAVHDGQTLAADSRAQYGTPRADVETALRARLAGGQTARQLGRVVREGEV